MKAKLEIVSLALSIITAGLAILNEQGTRVWSWPYAPQAFVALCCFGLVIYGLSLAGHLERASDRIRSSNKRVVGNVLALAAPLVAFAFWWFALRLSPERQKAFEDHSKLAKAFEIDANNPDEACREYQLAHEANPRDSEVGHKVDECEKNKKLP